MTENVHFEIKNLQYDDDDARIALDYSFWIPLMKYFLYCTNSFEIHCWSDEIEHINQISSEFGNQLYKRTEGSMTIFSGELNNKARLFLTNDCLTPNKRLKWFSVFLKFDGISKFSSEHYGTEFIGYNLCINDIEFIKITMGKDITLNTW